MKKIIKILIVVGIILLIIIVVTNLSKKPLLDDSFIGENRISSLPETAEILFVSNRDTGTRRAEIYSMDANGENQKRLTFTNEHHFIMGMDNSRRYIVTSRSERDTDKPKGLGDEDRRSLWLIDLQTKEEKRLTNIDNSAEGRTFSPDGEWIVFTMKVSGEDQLDIYKIKIDGTGLTKLTDTKTSIESDPAWSNNGDKISFSYLDGLDKNIRFIINKMDVDGRNIETVYDIVKGVWVPNIWPPGSYDSSWSPDDKWLVFESIVEYNNDNPENFGSGIAHIFKVKSYGTELVDLSELGGHRDRAEYLPSYSPDGKWIVFGSIHKAEILEESFSDIFKMDSETGEMIRLTHGPDNKYPIWIK